MEDLIDYPVSEAWRRHYASQGLTTQPGGSYSDDRVVDILRDILSELRRPPDEEPPPSYTPYLTTVRAPNPANTKKDGDSGARLPTDG